MADYKQNMNEETDFIYHNIQDTSTTNDYLSELFAKTFIIAENANYKLPTPDVMFTREPWQVEKLQELKEKLNQVKNCLNNYTMKDWQPHTKLRDKAGNIMNYVRTYVNPEFMTNAWCKFYELASTFPLIPMDKVRSNNNSFMTVHLCEAPGAFIAALNHWLRINAPTVDWDWTATSFNPYFEGNPLSYMIDDDRLIRHTFEHWCFGTDKTGNIMNLKNMDYLVKYSERGKEILLVTADGSIDCTEMPAEQEKNVYHLHYCEVVTMMHLLSLGGNFLLKIFTTFESHTVSLLYVLSCCFNKVVLTKPATSKEGNSETYVVCLDFKGKQHIAPYLNILRDHYKNYIDKAILGKTDIPESFLNIIIQCSEFFTNIQCKVIVGNIETFGTDKANDNSHDDINNLKKEVARKYMSICNLRSLDTDEVRIVGQDLLKKTITINTTRRLIRGSYNDRVNRKAFNWRKRLRCLLNESCENMTRLPQSKTASIDFKKQLDCLWLWGGPTVHVVKSSRFCKAEMLNIKNEVDDILRQNNIFLEFPTNNAIENCIRNTIKHLENCKILTFKYTDPCDTYNVFTKIRDALETLKFNGSLVLIGYSLLTLSNVGLLYLLQHTFTSIKAKIYKSMGCLITLKHYTKNPTVMTYFEEINNYRIQQQSPDEQILSIVPISVLQGCCTYNKIVNLNHQIIISYVQHAVITAVENADAQDY